MKIIQETSKKAQQAIYPFYEESSFCPNLSGLLGIDFKTLVPSEKGASIKVHTLNKLTSNEHLQVEEIIFLNLGKEEELTQNQIREYFGKQLNLLKGEVIVLAEKMVSPKWNAQSCARFILEGLLYAEYAYAKHGEDTQKDITISLRSKEDLSEVIKDTSILMEAINKARQLGNTPSNLMTPNHFVDYVRKLANDLQVELDVLDKKTLEELGMGSFLGVNLGSSIEAKMIVLKYNGAQDEAYTALVGKGITFDTGGYNLKSSAGMLGMKYDMCGAADVVSVFEVVVRRGLKVNLMAIAPLTENLISASAYKCDDVITSRSGKTIEVTNTDAEGRLILCDALTYAQNLGAKRVIDIATLTGAVRVALGSEFTGVFTNNEAFLNEFKQACKDTGEGIWQLPLTEGYTKLLKKSKVADLVNSPIGAGAGASMAASFLQEFIEESTEWIHLDIATTSTNDNGATGTMIASLVKLFDQ